MFFIKKNWNKIISINNKKKKYNWKFEMLKQNDVWFGVECFKYFQIKTFEEKLFAIERVFKQFF